MSISLIVILVVVAVVVVWVISAYNGLVSLRNRFKNAFAQIDVQLKRRYDLIPNLVETAKAYLAHERGTLQEVIAARNSADAARQLAAAHPENRDAVKGLSSAEVALSGTLGRFFALSEAYPDLKANHTMTQLMEELASTENRVGFSRQAFNDAVTAYNTDRESFPTNIIANQFSFGPAELLQIDNPEERKPVRVAF
jgi:LemA protein